MPRLNNIVIILAMLALASPAAASPRQDVLRGPFTGHVTEVLDGDTVTVRLRVWIGQDVETHVRIAGIDTPEMKGKCARERNLAAAAREELQQLLSDQNIMLYDVRLEKYAGRVLANATNTQGVSIADHLIGKGLARPYAGKKRDGWCGA